METSRSSKARLWHAVFLVDILEKQAALEIAQGASFAPQFCERGLDNLCLSRARHHDDTIGIADHKIAGTDAHPRAFDRYVDRHELAPALAVQRGNPPMEHRELHCHDGAGV